MDAPIERMTRHDSWGSTFEEAHRAYVPSTRSLYSGFLEGCALITGRVFTRHLFTNTSVQSVVDCPATLCCGSFVEDLSPRQRELLEFLVASMEQSGIVPSYREIGNALGIGSTNAVSDHLKALIRKGYVERVGEPGRPRSLRLTRKTTGFIEEENVTAVPVLGRIAAGVPLLAEQNYEGSIRVDQGLLPPGGSVFALIVTGDSMIEDGIFDGDTLFVRQRRDAKDGEIAVVMVDGEATVKRLFREGDRLRLQPANASMEPIMVDASSGEAEVIGVAVGVYRRILA